MASPSTLTCSSTKRLYKMIPFLVRKKSKPDVKKPTSPPLSPTANNYPKFPTSPTTPSPTAVISGEKKLKKTRRISQAIGDVIVPSPQVTVGPDGKPTSFAQTYSPTKIAFVVPERRKLSRNATATAGPASVIRSQHYPPRHTVASDSTLPVGDLTSIPSNSGFRPHTPPLVSESGHSAVSCAPSEMQSNCSSTRPVIGPMLRPRKQPSFTKLNAASTENIPMDTDECRSLRTKRRRRSMKRRMSLDLSALSQSIASATNTPTSASKPASVKRSRSLWASKLPEGYNSDALEGVMEDSFARSASPFTEKERTMNVRRAKKMAQLFGSEPPQALFQISHVESSATSSSDEHRTSLTTILSISTANLLAIPATKRERTISDASSLIFDNSPPITPIVEPEAPDSKEITPVPTPAATPHAHAMPFTSFATAAASEKHKVSPQSEKEFRQRRLRAVKLSKFFGVQIEDIKQYLPDKAPDRPGTALDTSVGIEIGSTNRTFWDRSNNHQPQQANMQEAIHRLRDLRAS